MGHWCRNPASFCLRCCLFRRSSNGGSVGVDSNPSQYSAANNIAVVACLSLTFNNFTCPQHACALREFKAEAWLRSCWAWPVDGSVAGHECECMGYHAGARLQANLYLDAVCDAVFEERHDAVGASRSHR